MEEERRQVEIKMSPARAPSLLSRLSSPPETEGTARRKGISGRNGNKWMRAKEDKYRYRYRCLRI